MEGAPQIPRDWFLGRFVHGSGKVETWIERMLPVKSRRAAARRVPKRGLQGLRGEVSYKSASVPFLTARLNCDFCAARGTAIITVF